jgi:hypothetical protein
MADEKKPCCVVICSDGKCRVVKSGSEEGKKILADLENCCEGESSCCE